MFIIQGMIDLSKESSKSATDPQLTDSIMVEASHAVAANSGGALVQVLTMCILTLLRVIESLKTQIKDLTEENKKLLEKVNEPEKTSENSSQSPSKDRYPKKSPKEVDENGKPIGKPGPKKGHKARHRKKPYTKKKKTGELEVHDLEIPTEEVEVKPDSTACPKCGSEMEHQPALDRIKEQIELVAHPLIRKLYRVYAYRCPDCNEIHYGLAPATLNTGLLGASLIAMLVFLRGVGHMSITSLQRFLAVIGLKVSRGFINNNLDKAAQSLDTAYNEIKEELPNQPLSYTDETGHKEKKKRLWTWFFRTNRFAFFTINVSRACSVIIDYLGSAFKGIIICDYAPCYQKYLRLFSKTLVQFCLFHLKRDIQFLVDHKTEAELNRYGNKLMDILKEIFEKNRLWQQLRRPRAPDDEDDPDIDGEEREAKAQEVLTELRQLAQRFTEAAIDAPNLKKAKNMAKRFTDWPQNPYFTFLTDEGIAAGVECSNNFAEQTARFVVMDRHGTQGTRSEKGRYRNERIWTVIASCAIKKGPSLTSSKTLY
jgi:hypothetical protein